MAQLKAGSTAGGQVIATQDWVTSTIIDGAPSALNTLNELAAAINDNSSYAASITTALAGKLDTTAKAADSDLLDGYHASSFWRNGVNNTWTPSTNILLPQSANSQEWSFDITRNGYTGGYWQVWDSSNTTMLKVDAVTGKVSAPYGFIGNLQGNITGSAASATTAGSATTATTATNLGSDYTADDWFRATGDNNHVKFYGNSRQMLFRTDGTAQNYDLGGYPFVWTYNGSSSGNRVMILHTDGRLWTPRYGWMDEAFLGKTAKAADSELLDGINSSSFLRSDADDQMDGTLTIQSGGANTYGRIRGYPNDNHFITIRGVVATGSSTLSITGGHRTTFVEHADAADEGWYFVSKASGSYTEMARIDGAGQMYIGGNKVWHAGNDGSGSGLDADTLDGVSSGSFLRSDANDTFTGTITMGKQHALVANNYGRGVYGLYDSYRYQHVWSMGTAYNLADNGTTGGNLYGLSWTHTNVGGESKAGLSHQLLLMMNGRTYTALGSGIWTDGTITTTSHGTSANWKAAYDWGNHASAGYLTTETYTGHENTSDLNGAYGGSNNGVVIEDITVDANGHVTAVGTRDLDGRFAAASHTHGIGSITDATRWWNNFGNNHTTRTSFDAEGASLTTGFGWRYIQGNGNGPGTDTSPNQFYGLTVGLGNDYNYDNYGMQLVIPRNTATPYISVRFEEGGALGPWQKISAGYADSAGGVAWANVSGKPTTFSPSAHTHTIANVTGLQTALDGKQAAGSYAASGHNHDGVYTKESSVRNLGTVYFGASGDTADFIAELDAKGCLAANRFSTMKVAWDYSGNSDLDTGQGVIELAGCQIDVITDSGSRPTITITRPTTGAGGGSMWVYNNQGSGYSPGWRQVWNSLTFNPGSYLTTSGKAADSELLDGINSSQFLRSDTSDTVAAGRQISFYSNDAIESASGDQASLEVFQDTSGADAFMQFHVSGDYALYFGLDGSTNDLAVGGWSMGANKYKVYHAGNLTLATLGYTGATNANYITNNNQLTNGAGYLTSTNDRVYITDSRGAARAPSYYNDRYAQWDFQNQADTGAGGDGWHSILTVSKWSSFHDSHRQEQIIFTGDNLKRRTANSDAEWGEIKTIWDTGNLDPVIDASVSNDTITFTRAGGGTFSVTTSDANTNTWRPLGTGANDAAAGNHTHASFSGGAAGFVPESTIPDDIDQNYYLNASGGWSIPPDNNTTYSVGDGGLTQKNFTNTRAAIVDSFGRNSASGAIAIGTSAGQAPFSVTNSGVQGIEFLPNDATSKTRILSYNRGLNVYMGAAYDGLDHVFRTSNTDRVVIDVNGLFVTGVVTASGDITAFSDVRVKENIQDLEGSLDKVTQLRGVSYNKIGSEEKSIGVIAQEIKEVLPEVVKEGEDGMLSVAYGNITAVLIEAIKEQQKQIDELKAKLDGLTK